MFCLLVILFSGIKDLEFFFLPRIHLPAYSLFLFLLYLGLHSDSQAGLTSTIPQSLMLM